MTAARAVTPLVRPLDADVSVPGSKSATNRALVAAALAAGDSTLDGLLLADDTYAMIDGLGRLGVAITLDESRARATVHGRAGALAPGPRDDRLPAVGHRVALSHRSGHHRSGAVHDRRGARHAVAADGRAGDRAANPRRARSTVTGCHSSSSAGDWRAER